MIPEIPELELRLTVTVIVSPDVTFVLLAYAEIDADAAFAVTHDANTTNITRRIEISDLIFFINSAIVPHLQNKASPAFHTYTLYIITIVRYKVKCCVCVKSMCRIQQVSERPVTLLLITG